MLVLKRSLLVLLCCACRGTLAEERINVELKSFASRYKLCHERSFSVCVHAFVVISSPPPRTGSKDPKDVSVTIMLLM